jgi:hypothetical protein
MLTRLSILCADNELRAIGGRGRWGPGRSLRTPTFLNAFYFLFPLPSPDFLFNCSYIWYSVVVFGSDPHNRSHASSNSGARARRSPELDQVHRDCVSRLIHCVNGHLLTVIFFSI